MGGGGGSAAHIRMCSGLWGPGKHFACQQLHIQRHFATGQLVDLLKIIINTDQKLILDIIGRRGWRKRESKPNATLSPPELMNFKFNVA